MKGAADEQIRVQLTVNGHSMARQVPLTTTLRDLLHDHLDHREVRYGCGEGVCGACTVLLDGVPVASCLKLAAQVQGADVVTATGLGARNGDAGAARVRVLQEHLLARGAFQCGYCACGMLVAAVHLLDAAGEGAATDVWQGLSGNLCRCSGYQQIIEGVEAAAAGAEPPSAAYPNPALQEKVTGAARYPTDAPVEDPLVGRILWSAYPSARITAIDTEAARAVPGVEAVLTYRDIPGRNRAGTNVFVRDQPLLAEDRVRSVGDAVALVAARTEAAAREALGMIQITYEPLPAVYDVAEAARPDAPRLRRGSNLIGQFTEIRGDVEAAFRDADVVVEGTYRCTVNDHACIELEGGLGWYEDGVLRLSISCETPYAEQHAAARALDVPPAAVQLVAGRMGGAFGKYLVASVGAHLALLVHKTGRPVRLVLDREDALAHAPKRHPFVGTYRLGLRADGTMQALEADVLADSGPYVSMTPAVISIFAVEAAGAYDIPNLRVRTRGVLTNNLPTAPMRGFGTQQISFGIESIVEKAAHSLGMDPAALRRKNFVGTRPDGRGGRVPDERIWLERTVDRVEAMLGPPPAPPEGWRHGRGFSSIHAKYGFPYGFVDRFTARVSVDAEGRFTVATELPDAGTGVPFGMASLVARRFGLAEAPIYAQSQDALDDPTGFLLGQGRRARRARTWFFHLLENLQSTVAGTLQVSMARIRPAKYARLIRWFALPVNLFNGLTGRLKARLFPYGPDSYIPRIGGSRSFYMGGNAVLDAADRLAQRALAITAQKLDVAEDELETGPRGVFRRDDSGAGLTWAALARAAGGTLSAIGKTRLPKGRLLARDGNQVGPVDFMDATHGCDVAVHPETGEVRVLQYAACHDVGWVANPATIRGQIIGGIAMGVGQALYEHLVVEHGRVETKTFHEYLVPTSLDVPHDVKVELLESHGGLGPNGARGIGEAAAVAAPNALANALYDALDAQLTTIPATPEAVVETLDAGRAIKPL